MAGLRVLMGKGHGGGAASVGGRCGVGYGGGGRQDMGYRMQDIQCGTQEVGGWMEDMGQVMGHWMWDVAYSMQGVGSGMQDGKYGT